MPLAEKQNNLHRRIFIALCFLAFTFSLLPSSTSAAGLLPTPTGRCREDYASANPTANTCKAGKCADGKDCDYALNDFKSLIAVIGNYILGISGSIVLLMFIYGGLTWLLSAGSAEKIGKGKKIIFGSSIGLILIFGAVTLIRVVLQSVGAPEEFQQQVIGGGAGAKPAAPTPTFACCVTKNKITELTGNQACTGGKKYNDLHCDGIVCCRPPSGPPEVIPENECAIEGSTKTDFDGSPAFVQNCK